MSEPAPPSPSRTRKLRLRATRLSGRAFAVAAVVLFLSCLAVRIPFLDHHGLWADELFSLAMATGHSLEHPADVADASSGDYVELPQAVAPSFYARHLRHESPPAHPARVVRAVFLSDTSPPGYYILLHFWTLAAGTGDVALRSFSLLWAMLAFPVIWSLARQVGGRWPAVVTGLIYAISPLCVFYSTEGRMYSMVWFWTACLMWLSLRLRREGPGQPLALAAWVVVGTAGMLTHYFFAFVLLGACLWLVLHPGKLGRGWIVGAAMAIGVLILPWYLRVPSSLAAWRVTGDWLDEPDARLNLLRQAVQLGWQFFTPRGPWGLRVRWDLAALAAFVALAWLARGRARWCRKDRRLLWLTLAAACLGPILFDLLRGTWVMMISRYAIAGLPAAFILIGIAIGRLSAIPRAALSLAVLGLSAVGLMRIYLNEGRAFEPMRLIAEQVAPELRPGELVIVHSIPSGVAGMARYLEESLPASAAPPAVASWVGQLERREMPRDLLELLEGRQRVTLIYVHEVGEPPVQLEWLRANATLDGERKVESIQVFSFVPREGRVFQFPDTR